MNPPNARVAWPLLVTMCLTLVGVYLSRSATSANAFMPHAHCYLFNRDLMLLHGGSDLLIGLSYVTISATLVWLVFRVRRELPFHWIMLAFATFIVACGATHFMEVWTLNAEHPRYWLSGWVKVLTAIASVTTAVVLPPLVPRIIGLLGAARLAAERLEKLERAYAELNERYTEERPGDLAGMVRELAEAKLAAERANAAKDEFLAALSHELRTPLTPVLMIAGEREKGSDVAPALREDFATIRKNVELEARLIDDLLDLTAITRGKLELRFETVDVRELVEHALGILRSEADAKNVAVTLDLAAPSHFVRGDSVRLEQVFWNVLKNAIKFTPAGGRIAVRTWADAGKLRVAVTDSGLGITPEEMPRIFSAFARGAEAAARFPGLGLGLSIASLLIKDHAGRIWAESGGRNRGSAFHLELPLVVEPPAGAKRTAPDLATTVRPLRILLVEDHADTLATLQRMLARWGHQVTAVSSVAEARGALGDGEFDLLMSDLGLTDGSGYDVIAMFLEKSNAPAVAMSGYGMDSDLARSSAAGFREHLVKPVSADRLRELLVRFAAE